MVYFNDKIIEIFGAWVTDYAPVLLLAALGLALLFFITVIAAIIRACVLKGKIKKLQAENAKAANAVSGAEFDSSALITELEQKQARIDELEEQLAAQASASDSDYSDTAPTDTSALDARIAGLTATVDELNDELDAKQRAIAELEQKLRDAENGNADGADKSASEKIEKLERTIKDKESEINLLKAENSQIKAQVLQQQLAATRNASTAEKTDKTERVEQRKTAAKETERAEKQTAAVKTDSPSAEDEYDEYYDDYGDETSAIKVTLKFDRVKNNWVILRTDTDRAYRRLSTKQEALMIAKDLARRLHAQLVVHKKDGKFQHI